MATPNLNITELVDSQTGKTVTINDALAKLDDATQGELAHVITGNTTVDAEDFTTYFAHVMGGAPGAAFNFNVPASKRLFRVENNSGQTATVQTTGVSPAGDAVVVQSGARALLYCDGENVHSVTGELIGGLLQNYRETHVAKGNVSGAVACDLRAGNDVSLTMTGNVTLSFTNVPASGAVSLTLEIAQDGVGGHAVTWPGSVLWPDGAAAVVPTDPDADAVVTLRTRDGGTTWRGFYAGGSFA